MQRVQTHLFDEKTITLVINFTPIDQDIENSQNLAEKLRQDKSMRDALNHDS